MVVVKKVVACLLSFLMVVSINERNSKCEAAQVVAGAEIGAVAGPIGAVAGAAIGAAVIAGGVYLAAEHTKGKRKSTHDKHTKPRPGRPTTKNRLKPNWKPR